jgi:hypothetical protein
VPRRFKNSFPDHHCQTVPEAGFAEQKNGALLSLAESAGYEVFVTMDKGLRYQQNLSGRRIAVPIVRAKSKRLVDLLPYVESCRIAMQSIEPGQVTRVGD